MRSLGEASCEARRFRSVKLSGGERQRGAIARAILADRPVLILEEGTHQELAGRPDGCYRRLYDTQAGAIAGDAMV